MKKCRFLLILCMLLGAAGTSEAGDFDYRHYERVLSAHVREGAVIAGVPLAVVDYGSLHRDAARADSAYRRLVEQLAAFDPEELGGRNEKMAFWINVYNIAAIKTIVDHYPVDSIRSWKIHWLGLPWNRKAITVGGREYSLAEIEFDLLVEGFRDLRVHFGINCASVSCVDLLPVPFRSETLDRQLEQQGRRFLKNREKGMQIDRARNTVSLSQVFKFDRKHFDEYAGGPLEFIRPYLADEDRAFLQKERPRIEYLDYNWTANDASLAEQQ